MSNLNPDQFGMAVGPIPEDHDQYPMRNVGPGHRVSIYAKDAEPVKDFHFKGRDPHEVGYVDVFHQSDDGYSGKPAAHVGFMAVRRDYQQRGLATALGQHVIDHAKEVGGSVEWGRIMHDGAEKMIRNMMAQHSDVRQYGKF